MGRCCPPLTPLFIPVPFLENFQWHLALNRSSPRKWSLSQHTNSYYPLYIPWIGESIDLLTKTSWLYNMTYIKDIQSFKHSLSSSNAFLKSFILPVWLTWNCTISGVRSKISTRVTTLKVANRRFASSISTKLLIPFK